MPNVDKLCYIEILLHGDTAPDRLWFINIEYAISIYEKISQIWRDKENSVITVNFEGGCFTTNTKDIKRISFINPEMVNDLFFKNQMILMDANCKFQKLVKEKMDSDVGEFSPASPSKSRGYN